MKYRMLIVMVGIVGLILGCSSIRHRNDPGVTVDTERVKYGESAFVPINDSAYWNGQPMDMRRGKDRERW